MLPLEGGGIMVRSPAEAGSSAGTVNRPAVNRRVYGPTDLEKEDEKSTGRGGAWGRAMLGLCITRLGLQPLLPRAVLHFLLPLSWPV